jgi:hypothetical protein
METAHVDNFLTLVLEVRASAEFSCEQGNLALISRIRNFPCLLIVVDFLCHDVSFRAIVFDEVSTFLELFQYDIIREEHDNCSITVILLLVLGQKPLADPPSDKLEPFFLTFKHLDFHLIGVEDLRSVASVCIHPLLSVVHYRYLMRETINPIFLFNLVWGYVIDRGQECLEGEVIYAVHDLKLLCT